MATLRNITSNSSSLLSIYEREIQKNPFAQLKNAKQEKPSEGGDRSAFFHMRENLDSKAYNANSYLDSLSNSGNNLKKDIHRETRDGINTKPEHVSQTISPSQTDDDDEGSDDVDSPIVLSECTERSDDSTSDGGEDDNSGCKKENVSEFKTGCSATVRNRSNMSSKSGNIRNVHGSSEDHISKNHDAYHEELIKRNKNPFNASPSPPFVPSKVANSTHSSIRNSFPSAARVSKATLRSMDALSHYDVLGIPIDAPQTAVRKAYLALARRLHPDKGGFAEIFTRLRQAMDVISDPVKRRVYDTCELPGILQTRYSGSKLRHPYRVGVVYEDGRGSLDPNNYTDETNMGNTAASTTTYSKNKDDGGKSDNNKNYNTNNNDNENGAPSKGPGLRGEDILLAELSQRVRQSMIREFRQYGIRNVMPDVSEDLLANNQEEFKSTGSSPLSYASWEADFNRLVLHELSTHLIVTCDICRRPSTLECGVCSMPLCSFCCRRPHFRDRFPVHWPVRFVSGALSDRVGQKELEAKRMEEAAVERRAAAEKALARRREILKKEREAEKARAKALEAAMGEARNRRRLNPISNDLIRLSRHIRGNQYCQGLEKSDSASIHRFLCDPWAMRCYKWTQTNHHVIIALFLPNVDSEFIKVDVDLRPLSEIKNEDEGTRNVLRTNHIKSNYDSCLKNRDDDDISSLSGKEQDQIKSTNEEIKQTIEKAKYHSKQCPPYALVLRVYVSPALNPNEKNDSNNETRDSVDSESAPSEFAFKENMNSNEEPSTNNLLYDKSGDNAFEFTTNNPNSINTGSSFGMGGFNAVSSAPVILIREAMNERVSLKDRSCEHKRQNSCNILIANPESPSRKSWIVLDRVLFGSIDRRQPTEVQMTRRQSVSDPTRMDTIAVVIIPKAFPGNVWRRLFVGEDSDFLRAWPQPYHCRTKINRRQCDFGAKKEPRLKNVTRKSVIGRHKNEVPSETVNDKHLDKGNPDSLHIFENHSDFSVGSSSSSMLSSSSESCSSEGDSSSFGSYFDKELFFEDKITSSDDRKISELKNDTTMTNKSIELTSNALQSHRQQVMTTRSRITISALPFWTKVSKSLHTDSMFRQRQSQLSSGSNQIANDIIGESSANKSNTTASVINRPFITESSDVQIHLNSKTGELSLDFKCWFPRKSNVVRSESFGKQVNGKQEDMTEFLEAEVTELQVKRTLTSMALVAKCQKGEVQSKATQSDQVRNDTDREHEGKNDERSEFGEQASTGVSKINSWYAEEYEGLKAPIRKGSRDKRMMIELVSHTRTRHLSSSCKGLAKDNNAVGGSQSDGDGRKRRGVATNALFIEDLDPFKLNKVLSQAVKAYYASYENK